MGKTSKTALGKVVKIYDSGICETDKGHKVTGTFSRGDNLELEINGSKRTITVKPKRGQSKKADESADAPDENTGTTDNQSENTTETEQDQSGE